MKEEEKQLIRPEIYSELHKYLTILVDKKGELEQESAMEIATYVAGSFLTGIENFRGKYEGEDYRIIYFLVDAFYKENFKGFYSQKDSEQLLEEYDKLMKIELKKRQLIIKTYLDNI